MFFKKSIIDRSKVIAIVFFSLLFMLILRLYYIQVHPTKLVQGELKNYQTEIFNGSRYSVIDTNGESLVNDTEKYVLVIDSKPFKLNNYEDTIEDLLALNFIMKSEYADFSYTDVMSSSGKLYYYLTYESYEKINKLKDIKGIYTYVYTEREAAEAGKIEDLIATVETSEIKDGSLQEKIYNYIKDNQYEEGEYSLNDKSIYKLIKKSDTSFNKNIQLTINKKWTEKVKEILNDESYSFLENIGVVLLESNTGKIRVLLQKNNSMANINLGIGSIGYEPGSIFKVLTDAIVLDMGLTDNNDVYSCSGEICSKNGEPYAHGPLTLNEALQISCNDIFAQVGTMAGYDNMLRYTEKLGLYQKVLNLSGENKDEAEGTKPTLKDGVSNFSIGQCVTVTPLQISGAINAVVNDGVYIKPYIIENIVDNNGNIISTEESESRRVFSKTTSEIVQKSMNDVIWLGTGYEARVEGINEGGKTGTSTGEGGATNHGWFAGYFEYNGQKYTLVVVAPNIGDKHPDGRELGGGNTGAPIFRDIVNLLIK
ncbi:MAG: penicillin-binding protein 2 [Clostridium sp.]|nr:penicillin-binding protein 2 [Clostridium sp.]